MWRPGTVLATKALLSRLNRKRCHMRAWMLYRVPGGLPGGSSLFLFVLMHVFLADKPSRTADLYLRILAGNLTHMIIPLPMRQTL